MPPNRFRPTAIQSSSGISGVAEAMSDPLQFIIRRGSICAVVLVRYSNATGLGQARHPDSDPRFDDVVLILVGSATTDYERRWSAVRGRSRTTIAWRFESRIDCGYAETYDDCRVSSVPCNLITLNP
ncbi:hypothetical protein NMY22_g14543 [Coprinellus aureogranulatus]|nr:hypothetical protein NMY22_g14543 [Coprinellus aureogranulatus]